MSQKKKFSVPCYGCDAVESFPTGRHTWTSSATSDLPLTPTGPNPSKVRPRGTQPMHSNALQRISAAARRFSSYNRTTSSAVPLKAAPSEDTSAHSAKSAGRVPPSIWQKTSAHLHTRHAHPLNTLRHEIQSHFNKAYPSLFDFHNDISPIVSTEQCFDDLLVPLGHVSRAPSDTYYIDDHTVLRTHMTAHDVSLLRRRCEAFVLCGDVYRRDTVDRTHYPVFHQIDAVRLYPPHTDRQQIIKELQATLTGLARHLFGKDANLRWVDAYFPFTNPSFELEVQWKGEWLELLGCGLLQRGVLSRGGVDENVDGWAFGLGLERLAMVLFDIPDIRLFWSEDPRVLSQFEDASLQQRFIPFSVYPSIRKDISFWVEDEDNFHDNDLHEMVRALAGDLVESVTCVDRFEKNGKTSLCYRIEFQSMERNLTHVEINEIYHMLRKSVSTTLPVTLR